MPDAAIALQRAGLLRRIAAAVYDALLIGAILLGATLVVVAVVPTHRVDPGTIWFQLYLAVAVFLFYGWFWTHGGQTLGMRAWRLRAQMPNGGALSWGRSLARYVAAWAVWATVVGLLPCVFGRHRALQDLLSGTEVVVLPKLTR